MIKAILFDYGGTLVQSKKSWQEVRLSALRRMYRLLELNGLKSTFDQFAEIDTSNFQRFTTLEAEQSRDIPDITRYQELVDVLFPERSEAWRRRMASRLNDTFWDLAVRNFAIRKNVRRCLVRLKSMNVRMAIVSNHHNPQALLDHLDRLRISSYFSRVFISASVGYRKPDPQIFNECLAWLGVDRRQAIFVGDSREYDVEGARRAGMRSILVSDDVSGDPTGESTVHPDFHIHDFMEIPEIISLSVAHRVQWRGRDATTETPSIHKYRRARKAAEP